MRIYDCFAFFNELDLLELRLETLQDVVDIFVIVESTHTFSGMEKPLNYRDNEERYAKWHDKIRYIVVDNMPHQEPCRGQHRWDNDYFQKDQLVKGIADAEPNDVIMFSDLDEIPKPEIVQEAASRPGITCLVMHSHHFFLNWLCNTNWRGTVVAPYSRFKQVLPRYLREKRHSFSEIRDAGWHFTYMGGPDKVEYKINSFAHSEFDTPQFNNQEHISASMDGKQDLWGNHNLEVLPLDDRFPKPLVENRQKYERFIRE